MQEFLFDRIANTHKPSSFASRLRQKRLALFLRLLQTLPRPLTILDVGGTDDFWQDLHFKDPAVKIVLLNPRNLTVNDPMFESVVGDARDLGKYGDSSFDVIYSNSVIEHVGGDEDQQKMAKEIRRVAKRYFVQTPNFYFPIEPHFLFPGFQFLPLQTRAFLLTKAKLGWVRQEVEPAQAMAAVSSIRLLSPSKMRRLFPDAVIYHERLLGITKSIIAYNW